MANIFWGARTTSDFHQFLLLTARRSTLISTRTFEFVASTGICTLGLTCTKRDSRFWKSCLVKPLYPLGLLCNPGCQTFDLLWQTRMDKLPPLFVIILCSIGGKTEHWEILAYHGRFKAVARGRGSANHSECMLTQFSHTTTSNPEIHYENFKIVKSGVHYGINIFRWK